MPYLELILSGWNTVIVTIVLYMKQSIYNLQILKVIILDLPTLLLVEVMLSVDTRHIFICLSPHLFFQKCNPRIIIMRDVHTYHGRSQFQCILPAAKNKGPPTTAAVTGIDIKSSEPRLAKGKTTLAPTSPNPAEMAPLILQTLHSPALVWTPCFTFHYQFSFNWISSL